VILGELQSNPKKAVPLAMAILSAGLCLGMLGTALTRTGLIAQHWSDFGRGFCFGLGITMECFAVVLLVAANRKRRN
jgi:hypothetical protein